MAVTTGRGRIVAMGGALVEQSMQSVVILITGLVAANRLSAGEFGIFALVLSGLTVSWGLWRALLIEPFFTLAKSQTRVETRRSFNSMLRILLQVNLPVMSCALVAGLLTEGVLGVSLVGLSVVGILLAAFDAVRATLIASESPFEAASVGLLWLGSFLASLVAQQVMQIGVSLLGLMVALIGSTAVALLVGVARLYSTHGMPLELAALVGQGRPLAADFLLVGATVHLVAFVVAALSSMEQAAGYRGALLLCGPITTLMGGLRLGMLADASRYVSERSDDVDWNHYLLRTTGVLLIPGSIAVAAVIAISYRYGARLLGDTWEQSRSSIVPFAIGAGATALHLTTGTVLRIRGLADEILRIRLLTTLPAVTLTVAGAYLSGSSGASWGFMAGVIMASPVWWYTAIRPSHDRPTARMSQ